MSSRLSDPNNHVPEVSPDDDWEDAEGAETDVVKPTATALPPRRKAGDRAPEATVAEEGLRIGTGSSRIQADDSTESGPRLQVQEINAGVIRLEQEIPAPPRMERQVVFHERPAREEGKPRIPDEHHEWGKSIRRPALWIATAGVGVAAIVVVALMLLPSINAPNKPRERPAAVMEPAEEVNAELEAINDLILKQPEAEQLFRAYASAVQADDILPMIRDGASLGDTLRARWTPTGISRQRLSDMTTTWSIPSAEEKLHGVLEGTLPDGKNFSACMISEDGRLLLDWKATTAFGTALFSELESGSGDSSEIRGVLSPANFYSISLPEGDYHSFRYNSPDNRTQIWCYVRRGTEAESRIMPYFQTGEIVRAEVSPRRMTLRLERGPEGARPNQWIVGEMLHIGWVRP